MLRNIRAVSIPRSDGKYTLAIEIQKIVTPNTKNTVNVKILNSMVKVYPITPEAMLVTELPEGSQIIAEYNVLEESNVYYLTRRLRYAFFCPGATIVTADKYFALLNASNGKRFLVLLHSYTGQASSYLGIWRASNGGSYLAAYEEIELINNNFKTYYELSYSYNSSEQMLLIRVSKKQTAAEVYVTGFIISLSDPISYKM